MNLEEQVAEQENIIARLTDRLEVMTEANQMWSDKWERMQCEWCGTSNAMGDGSDMDGA